MEIISSAEKVLRTITTRNDWRARLTRHNTEDIADVSLYEIRMALMQLQNSKAPGEDGITAELLKAVGKPALRSFKSRLIPSYSRGKCYRHGTDVWWYFSSNKVIMPWWKTHKPISLLSHVYKLFSRVIMNRLALRLGDFQPPEQARFRNSCQKPI